MEISPQEQNCLETATATVVDRSRGGFSHKNTTLSKADGFPFWKILSN
ncbi:hypothetical protein QUA62_14920 [Microcoleus sp. MON1_C1]